MLTFFFSLSFSDSPSKENACRLLTKENISSLGRQDLTQFLFVALADFNLSDGMNGGNIRLPQRRYINVCL